MPFEPIHGMTGTPEYRVWKKMRERCNNPSAANYEFYGGRGIEICARWDDFLKFYEDMGPRPDGHSIDRINNDGNYEPGNCRWATKVQQMNNRSNSRRYDYRGQMLTVREMADLSGQTYAAIKLRLKRGWDVAEAVETPRKTGKYLAVG